MMRPADEDFQSAVDDALDRMKRAHGRRTGCRLTADMIEALSVTAFGQLWNAERADREGIA